MEAAEQRAEAAEREGVRHCIVINSQKQRNIALTRAPAQTIHYTRN